MRKRIRKWIVDMAPIWAKASLQADIRTLEAENRRLWAEVDTLNAYIQGLQYATRALRRITINAGGEKRDLSEQ